MSVIGPRPGLWNQDILTAERDKYNANDVKPGLTGWAQINGRDELEIPEKARLDGEYCKNIGIMMDVKVFLKSLGVFSGDSSVVEGGTGNMSMKCETNEGIQGENGILTEKKNRYSVLMSVYKNDNPDFLKIALESIYDIQTVKPDEIVVVFDGALNDRLYSVLDEFKNGKEDVVKYYPQATNSGLGEALRIGSEYCTDIVDKYEAKRIVGEIIGEKYIIPTLGVWDRFDDIDFELLPNQFVLKCTHDSGGLVICKDKSKFDVSKAKSIIENCLKHSFYWGQREWPYKNVKPRIIAEKYMEDSITEDLRDYKFFAFDGEVKALFIATERQTEGETKFDFFDSDFNHLNFTNGHPNAEKMPLKPQNFDLMKTLAAELSRGIPHVRVDFYEVNGEVYFGEMTFSHWSGMMPFDPEEWDYKFGNWIKLK